VTFGCELVLAVVVVMDTEAAKGHVMVLLASPPNHSAHTPDHIRAPTGGQDTLSTVFWYMQNYSMKESQNDKKKKKPGSGLLNINT
jgi:hypothetical protein